jgi:ubiquinone/menaquinone biosynthesis C-methylase UbiE
VVDEWENSHYSLYDEFFWSRMKKNSIILDLGCGKGPYHGISDLNHFRTLALDSAYNLIRHANTRSNQIQLLCADAHKIPLRSNSVDGVAAVWFVEHLKEPPVFFAELSRILKPGGIAFIVTPNLTNPLNISFLLLPPQLRDFITRILAGHPEDYKTYCKANTTDKINQLCHQQDLQIDEIQYVFNTRMFEFLPYGGGLYRRIVRMSDDNPLEQFA